MENKLSKLYNELRMKIVAIIPEQWKNIYFLGEIDKTGASAIFYFKEAGSGEYVKSCNIPYRYDVSEEVYELLMEEVNEILLKIYSCSILNSKRPWEQIRLAIGEEGSFNIDYIYGTISNNEMSPMERELVWAYEAFGNIPKEGTYMRKILDTYLKKIQIKGVAR